MYSAGEPSRHLIPRFPAGKNCVQIVQRPDALGIDEMPGLGGCRAMQRQHLAGGQQGLQTLMVDGALLHLGVQVLGVTGKQSIGIGGELGQLIGGVDMIVHIEQRLIVPAQARLDGFGQFARDHDFWLRARERIL